jgi:hypothetical protein
MKKIIDCTTGDVTEREFNADELSQQEIDQAAFEAAEAIRLAEAEARAEAKATAQAKLAALGLTVADLEALGL